MDSDNPEIRNIRPRKQKPSERGHCPVCGKQRLSRPASRQNRSPQDWDAGELEQLVEEMKLSDVARLLGISRWELEKRCQSLGIDIRGLEEEEG
jgi:hypothetical protein